MGQFVDFIGIFIKAIEYFNNNFIFDSEEYIVEEMSEDLLPSNHLHQMNDTANPRITK